MKTRLFPIMGLVLALSLSGCANIAAPLDANTLSDVYTAVAATVTAQASPVTPTELPAETSRPTGTSLLVQVVTPTATPTASSTWWYSTTSGCEYDADFIKDVTIPDETVLSPGETFTKTWRLKNTGGCTWASNFTLAFIRGQELDGSDTEIDETVYAGQKLNVSVEMTAPDDEGTYSGYWQLEDSYGNRFGQAVYVKIVVDDTATSTPTATATSTNTATATVSPTAAPTSTAASATATLTASPTPTSTSTPTPTPTATAVLATATDAPATSTATPTSTPESTSTDDARD